MLFLYTEPPKSKKVICKAWLIFDHLVLHIFTFEIDKINKGVGAVNSCMICVKLPPFNENHNCITYVHNQAQLEMIENMCTCMY